MPGGALADGLPWKRGLAATGLLMIACAATLMVSSAKSSFRRDITGYARADRVVGLPRSNLLGQGSDDERQRSGAHNP